MMSSKSIRNRMRNRCRSPVRRGGRRRAHLRQGSGGQAASERTGDRRFDDGRAPSMAQGDADADRPAGRRTVDRAEPVHGLSHDGDLCPRVRRADIPGARLLCGRRRRRQLIRDGGQQVAGASGAGQDRTLDVSDFVRVAARESRWPRLRRAEPSRRSTAGPARFKSPRPTRNLQTFERAGGCSTRANTICSLPAAATTS